MELTPVAVQNLRAAITGSVISFIVLVLKFVARYRSKSTIGWDDALVAVAWTITVPIAVVFYEQGIHGLGYPPSALDPDTARRGTQWFWVGSWLYYLALGLSKLSVLIQFFRIFVTPRTLLVTKCAIGFVICWTIISVCVAAFECIPIAGYWDKRLNPKCINGGDTFIANATMNIFTDFVIILIPVPSLMRLQVGIAKKLGLVFAFSIGSVACAISIARIPMVMLAFKAGKPGNLSLMMWSAIEVNVCIICACLPSIRSLFVSFLRLIGLNSLGDTFSKSSGLRRTSNKKSGYGVYSGNSRGTLGAHARRSERSEGGGQYFEMEDGIQVETRVEVKTETSNGQESRKSDGDDDSIDRLVHMPRKAYGMR